ncbi:hypothetical protein GJ496_010126 [Pomphorhynchus laevis]|nr:hypothetical protein GJ496_010126 [Pomphorhynchus laevis]
MSRVKNNSKTAVIPTIQHFQWKTNNVKILQQSIPSVYTIPSDPSSLVHMADDVQQQQATSHMLPTTNGRNGSVTCPNTICQNEVKPCNNQQQTNIPEDIYSAATIPPPANHASQPFSPIRTSRVNCSDNNQPPSIQTIRFYNPRISSKQNNSNVQNTILTNIEQEDSNWEKSNLYSPDGQIYVTTGSDGPHDENKIGKITYLDIDDFLNENNLNINDAEFLNSLEQLNQFGKIDGTPLHPNTESQHSSSSLVARMSAVAVNSASYCQASTPPSSSIPPHEMSHISNSQKVVLNQSGSSLVTQSSVISQNQNIATGIPRSQIICATNGARIPLNSVDANDLSIGESQRK